MTRTTSIQAYHKIKDEGLLSQRRWEVYDALFKHGPKTGGELFNICGGVVKGSVCARLTELRDLGVAYEQGTKTCDLTGQTAILWDVTDKLPKKKNGSAIKPPTRNELIAELSDKLEIATDYLESNKGKTMPWSQWAQEARAVLKHCAPYRSF
jgi:hypothetical protein